MAIPGSKTLFKSLPQTGLDADGTFIPSVNVAANTFSTITGNDDAPFNSVLIGSSADNLVGSATTPYLPVSLPAYIPTLYTNIYNIQTGLTDVIPTTDISNNRAYPTVYAVKKYISDQIGGSQTLTASDTGTISSMVKISTGLANTILTGVPDSTTAQGGNVVYSLDNGLTNVFDIASIDSAKNGSSKRIINSSIVNGTYFMTIQLSGNKYFIVNGNKYKNYQFSVQGDALDMVQFINSTGVNVFFVLSYGGVFSEVVA